MSTYKPVSGRATANGSKDCQTGGGVCRHALKHKLRGAYKLRHFGLGNCLRVLLARPEWCLAFARFNIQLDREQPGSIFASQLCARFCQLYIPGWDELDDKERLEAETRFLRTGQVCSDDQLHPHQGRMRTILLFVEQASDGFQPFQRRVHSTWVQCVRCALQLPSRRLRCDQCVVSSLYMPRTSTAVCVQGGQHASRLCHYASRRCHSGNPGWPCGAFPVRQHYTGDRG